MVTTDNTCSGTLRRPLHYANGHYINYLISYRYLLSLFQLQLELLTYVNYCQVEYENSRLRAIRSTNGRPCSISIILALLQCFYLLRPTYLLTYANYSSVSISLNYFFLN